MAPVSAPVQDFFARYERGTNGHDPDFPAAFYGDSFLFAGPAGAQAVQKADFLKVLPRRAAFFQTIGLTATTLQRLDETRLDDHYVQVAVVWQMRFEKDPAHPLLDDNSATYVLHQHADGLRIVFQLDHQDLMARVVALGLVPPNP
jgi:hypothetical protein